MAPSYGELGALAAVVCSNTKRLVFPIVQHEASFFARCELGVRHVDANLPFASLIVDGSGMRSLSSCSCDDDTQGAVNL